MLKLLRMLASVAVPVPVPAIGVIVDDEKIGNDAAIFAGSQYVRHPVVIIRRAGAKPPRRSGWWDPIAFIPL